MNEQRRERGMKLRVGIFVLVSLAAFLGMIYALGARARLFEARYTLHAEFTEVGGLAEGATVRLAGVQIGRVSGVHLPSQPGGKVRVDLSITKQYADRIRKNSVARIDTQGLLGDKIVEITVGTPGAPVVRPGEVLAARDPADVGQVLSQGADTVKSVAALADSLRQTAETFNKSRVLEDIAGATASARHATDQLARITTEVESGRAESQRRLRAGRRGAGHARQPHPGLGRRGRNPRDRSRPPNSGGEPQVHHREDQRGRGDARRAHRGSHDLRAARHDSRRRAAQLSAPRADPRPGQGSRRQSR